MYVRSQAHSKLVRRLEVVKGNLATLRHSFLALTNPNARIVLLLVRLVRALGVANLGHQVVLLVENKVTDTLKIGELSVSVNVHLNDTIVHSSIDLLLLRARATVEDQENRVFLVSLELVAHIVLVHLQELRAQHHIAGLVHTVDIAESSSNAEVGGDLAERLVDVPNVLRLRV